MKEDVVAANLANLRQSINELKECIEKQNATVPKPEQSVKADFNEKAIYTGIAKSFCTCWNEALSVVKKHIWQQQPDRLPFSLWFPKLIDLFKQKSTLLEYLYRHVCDYNQNCMTIETNTRYILKRQDEILVKINELKSPVTVIPPNISGLFICGYHIKLQYIVPIIAVIIICNHTIFRHANFIGCLSADKIKMPVRKYFCFNIPVYRNMAEEPSCRSPYHEEYIQTSVSGNSEGLCRSTYSFLSERR